MNQGTTRSPDESCEQNYRKSKEIRSQTEKT